MFRNKFKHTGFNGNVLVARNGVIIYRKSWGYSNYTTKDSLTLRSAFQLGSTAKPLTATAILILKDQGKLNLSQTLNDFFPEFPYKNITISQLLSHRSGLSNYMYFCDSLYCCKNKLLSNDELLKIMIERQPALYARPDKKFEYCNTNYSLLVNIIEKVSGKTYAEFMKEEIFAPLGMDSTWVSAGQTNNTHKNKTTGYKSNWQHYDDDYLDGVLGDKNIFTTIDDLLLFDQALYSEKLLKKETLAEAFTGASHEHAGKRNYGYGWRIIDEANGNKIVYHNGWWHGYNNVFWRRPKDKTTVIILSNKINFGVYHIEGILNILDGKTGKNDALEEQLEH